jgi:hypothetical protein
VAQWWRGDYADIRDRIRRYGRLDTDDVWLPDSDDSWAAFRARHGWTYFDDDFRELDRRAVEAKHRTNERRALEAQRQQEEWEAAQRRRMEEKQAAADRDWNAIEIAKTYWKRVWDPHAAESYHSVTIRRTCRVLGVTLNEGNTYWLPKSIMLAVTKADAA